MNKFHEKSLWIVLFLVCVAFADNDDSPMPFDMSFFAGLGLPHHVFVIMDAFHIMEYSVWNPKTQTMLNFSFVIEEVMNSLMESGPTLTVMNDVLVSSSMYQYFHGDLKMKKSYTGGEIDEVWVRVNMKHD